MREKIIPVSLFVLSIAAIALGYALYYPETVGLCLRTYPDCLGQDILYGVAYPLFLSIRWLPFFFFALIFVRREVFISWLKFIWWAALVPVALIVAAPPSGEMFTPDRFRVTEWMVNLLVIVSVLFIAWKYWRLRKKKSEDAR